jgi:hypothetical protein
VLGTEGVNARGWVSTYGDSIAWMRPRGMCRTAQGLLVCDSGHHRIRCVSPDGARVAPFAGCGKKGHKDGPVDKAQFDTPHSICVCPSDGSLIVADTGNHMLRRIHRGQVTTLAGGGTLGADKPGPGFVDGEASRARFRKPSVVLFDGEESLLVIDSMNHCIRVVSPDWTEVRTLAGGPQPGSKDGPVDVCEFHCPVRDRGWGLGVRLQGFWFRASGSGASDMPLNGLSV